MTIESTRRVQLSWPTSSNVQPLAPSTVADIKAAFAAWVAELAGQGCPDTAAAGYDHRFQTGGLADLVAVWPAAESVGAVEPDVPCGEKACPYVHIGETISAVYLDRIAACPSCPGERIISHDPDEAPPDGDRPMPPEDFALDTRADLNDAIAWVNEHGYVAAFTGAPNRALLYARGDGPVQMAQVGDVLRWDGQRIGRRP